MWVQAAMMGFQAISGYKNAKARAKYQRRMQEYKNKMTNIANAINQNAITTNTTLQIQQSAKQAVHMRKDELTTLASTAVAAAAAGVRGNSVTQTLLNVQQNASGLEKQRQDDLQQYFLQADQQRLSSTLSAVQNQDLSYIAKPKLSNYLLGAAADFAGSSQGQKALGSIFGSGGGSFPNVRTDSFSNGISSSHFSRSNTTVYWR